MTGAVGLITEPDQAEKILKNNEADVIFMGRELLRNPYWPLSSMKQLDGNNFPPNQYLRSFLVQLDIFKNSLRERYSIIKANV